MTTSTTRKPRKPDETPPLEPGWSTIEDHRRARAARMAGLATGLHYAETIPKNWTTTPAAAAAPAEELDQEPTE